MTYENIAGDLEQVQHLKHNRVQGGMLDTEIVWFVLRPLHVIAHSLERIADRYCGSRKAG